MTRSKLFIAATFFFAGAGLLACGPAAAQRHSFGSSPPTAPPPPYVHPPAPPSIAPVLQSLGPLQLVTVNYGVLPPQALTRQLQSEDERTRLGALSSLGVPGQYLVRGRVPVPRSLSLQFVALGTTEELDALLTVELDQHLVTAILKPDEGGWRRIATVTCFSPFTEPVVNLATFLQTPRSLLQPSHYRAVFHGSVHGSAGDYSETEANLRILNDRAVVMLSFTSEARSCSEVAGHAPRTACELTRRWVESDPADSVHRVTLVTGTGRLPIRDGSEGSPRSRLYLASHLRTFTCQPYLFSEVAQHFEPAGAAIPCPAR